ncbi:hypothetical protein HYW21_03335 [Candidatus Woesearchaeota archaeon]|nr:hypothetical protein [Candidatus Woesearchaeota archaeon]
MRSGQGLSLTTVVIAVLVIIVLIVLLVIFTTQLRIFGKDINESGTSYERICKMPGLERECYESKGTCEAEQGVFIPKKDNQPWKDCPGECCEL